MIKHHQQTMQRANEDLQVCREEIAKGEEMIKVLESRIKAKSEQGLDVSFEKDKIAKINTAMEALKANVAKADNSVGALIVAYALMESLGD